MTKRVFFISWIFWWAIIGVATAQESTTPQPEFEEIQTPGIVANEQVNLIFPAAIDFRAQLVALPEDLISAEFALQQVGDDGQTGGYETTITLDLESAISSGALDTLNVSARIEFDPENLPRLFEPLNYRFQVLTVDGVLSEIGDQVIFAPNFESNDDTWRTSGDSSLVLWSHDPQLGLAILGDTLLPVYNLLSQHQDQPAGTGPTFQFVIYNAERSLCESFTDPESGETRFVIPNHPEFDCDPDEIRALYADQGYQLIQRQDSDFQSIQNQLIAEMVTYFYADLWAMDTVPAWFLSGLTQFYNPVGDLRATVLAQIANDSRQLLGLNRLATTPQDEDERPLWNAQSYLMVLFLADMYGADAPIELAQDIIQADDFGQAFQAFTELDTVTFYRTWEAWLDSERSQEVAIWNPYLSTTNTPTPTPTETPLPPTHTPTSTPSNTPTATPSPTQGAALPTEVPSNTPSPSPQARQPTNTPSRTPLPPGSLPTATPIPASASETASDDSGGGLPCGSAMLVLPTLGLVWISQKKRKSETNTP